jgi:photosystem II stability/assembly factor-like uncharacterized protein
MRALVLLALVAFASAAQWTTTTNPFATIAFDVSFVDVNNGMTPVDINGQGSFVWITKDGGKNWTPAPEMDPAALYIGGAMAAVYNGVVTEPAIVYASDETDHWNFTASIVEPTATWTSQNVETFANGMFAATGGDPDVGEGVIVSEDGGATFVFSGTTGMTTQARYGAFPSATTWYVSGGEWPRRQHAIGTHESLVRELSSRIHYVRSDAGYQQRVTDVNAPLHDETDPNGWKAQIIKSTDGGKTWTTVFSSDGKFYFNQISCGDVNTCCAVGEADNGTAPGVRVHCTKDGGATWTQTLFHAGADYSGLALQFTPGSSTEVWAPIGNLVADNFGTIFYRSTDGGATWTDHDELTDVFANCISMLDSNHGYATAVTVDQQSAFLTFA